MSRRFVLESPFTPAGDQVQAIDRLVAGLADGVAFQTLLGVTGSGKTFTMAKLIEASSRPTLVYDTDIERIEIVVTRFAIAQVQDNSGLVSIMEYFRPPAAIEHKLIPMRLHIVGGRPIFPVGDKRIIQR